MLGNHWRGKPQKALPKAVISWLLSLLVVTGLAGCGGSGAATTDGPRSTALKAQNAGQITEVSPPDVLQQLRDRLDSYQPQVQIISPKADETLSDNKLQVQLQVQDLPLFKDEKLGLGPHLHVILDNQPYKPVYDLKQPLTFEDLTPGTHTLRVFASRPWHESFKNEGAYAQTTFHVLTKTDENNPDPKQPLLTYSRPTGSYGAEPILLDFYLTNAPLHLVAQENPDDEIADWRIRVTVNDQSFVLDQWQPVYLKGFQPGKNWVKLEFIDEKGNPVNNVFNNSARLITYEPKGKDTLARLVRGELSLSQAQGIVDPTYNTPPLPEPTPEPIPEPTPEPTLETPSPTPEPTPEEQPTAPEQAEKPKGGFFNRFRRPAVETPAPSPEPVVEPEEVEEVEPSPEESPAEAPEASTPEEDESPEVVSPQPLETPQGGFFSRFRRPAVETPTSEPEPIAPELAPAQRIPLPGSLPEVDLTPTPEPELANPAVDRSPPVPKQPSPEPLPEMPIAPKTEPEIPITPEAGSLPDLPEVVIPPTPAPIKKLPIITAPATPDIPPQFLRSLSPQTPEDLSEDSPVEESGTVDSADTETP